MAKRKKKKSWGDAPALCNTLSPDQDALTGEIVTRIAEKWSLWAMSVLALAGKPLRFSRVMEQVKGVSQKSLTKTLRALERDGLVARRLFAEVPPRVEYSITPLGSELLEHVQPLWIWVAKSVRRFAQARATFDDRKRKVGSLQVA
jgi:DNA-binding HxlR family transcriptional regulator